MQCKDLCIDDAQILSDVLSRFGGDDGDGDNDDDSEGDSDGDDDDYIDDNDDDEEYIDDAEILSDVLSVVRRITGAE